MVSVYLGEVGTFDRSRCAERPARTTDTLIFHRCYGTHDAPIDRVGNRSVAAREFLLGKWKTAIEALAMAAASKNAQFVVLYSSTMARALEFSIGAYSSIGEFVDAHFVGE